jgi:putative transposase
LVDKNHPEISMRKPSILFGVARSTITCIPVDEDPEDLRIKRLVDEIYLKDPCLGNRRFVTVLERGHDVKMDRKRLARLRRDGLALA